MIARLRTRLDRLVRDALRRLGYEIYSRETVSNVLSNHTNALEEILRLEPSVEPGEAAVAIAFSKDRPMQLHALLRSYYSRVSNPVPLTVLYSASNSDFCTAYEEVKTDFSGLDVSFLREQDFRRDLIRLLDDVDAEKVLFLVDDILFIRPLDMLEYVSLDPRECVPSLRLGRNLNYCYTAAARQPPPVLTVLNPSPGKRTVYSWSWLDATHDWAYPLSLDGNLFLTREMRVMVKIATFQAPNSLERSLQWFLPAYCRRRGICYEKSVLVNVPLNKVQVENRNFAGDVGVQALLGLWREGYRIDVDKYLDICTLSAHQVLPLFLVPRETRT